MKNYPLRANDLEEKPERNKLYDICSCGHAWHNHQLQHKNNSTQCEICTCPKYEFENQLLMDDYISQDRYIRNKNRGFTT